MRRRPRGPLARARYGQPAPGPTPPPLAIARPWDQSCRAARRPRALDRGAASRKSPIATLTQPDISKPPPKLASGFATGFATGLATGLAKLAYVAHSLLAPGPGGGYVSRPVMSTAAPPVPSASPSPSSSSAEPEERPVRSDV